MRFIIQYKVHKVAKIILILITSSLIHKTNNQNNNFHKDKNLNWFIKIKRDICNRLKSRFNNGKIKNIVKLEKWNDIENKCRWVRTWKIVPATTVVPNAIDQFNILTMMEMK